VEKESILHDKKVVNTMRKVSKLGVYLPSLLLIIALIIVFTAPKKDAKTTPQVLVQLTPTVTPSPAIKININLKGPFTCEYVTNTATVSAYIKNKQIVADFVEASQESHFLYKSDCLYQWNSLKPNGIKQCGLSTAVDTVDMLSSFGLLDFGSILGMVPTNLDGAQKEMTKNTSGIQKFMETCVKKEPPVEKFNVPVDRIFLEPTVGPTPAL
jgi:hypothetical protein